MDEALDQIAQDLLGQEWYEHAFGGLHVAGRMVASAFGGAGLADAAERLEDPILPAWAKRGGQADIRIFDNMALPAMQAASAAKAAKKGGKVPAAGIPSQPTQSQATSTITEKPLEKKDPDIAVSAPDYIALVHKSAKPTDQPAWVAGVVAIGVWGGRRFGSPTPYDSAKGVPGKTFSFGYNAPLRVDVVTPGQDRNFVTTSMRDVRQILFAGGTEIIQQEGGLPPVVGALTGVFWDEPLWREAPFKRWHAALGALTAIVLALLRK